MTTKTNAIALTEFARAYIECALWSSMDNATEQGGEPLDANYDASDIAPETLTRMLEDCATFQHANRALLDEFETLTGRDTSYAGHDFWLTRNHHGAGFWDRGAGAIGKALTQASHAFGEFDLYIGDDGQIHH